MKLNEKKNIINIVGSRSISRIGDIVFDFANTNFLAHVSTNSLMLLGLYQALENIIGVILNLLGGVIADRFKRKKILISSNILSGIVCVGLSFISQEVWLIYAVIIINAILAIISSFSSPSYKAFTKEIVEKQNITRINSYLEVSNTTIKVTVPVIAALLYKWLGVHGVLLIDGVTFFFSGLLIILIKPINVETEKNENTSIKIIFSDLLLGIKYLIKHQEILIVIILSALVNFFLAAYNLVLPYSNQMFHGISDNLYSLFLTAEAVGGLLGATLSRYLNKDLLISKLMIFLGISGFSLLISPIIFLIFHNLTTLLFAIGGFNLFLTIFNIQFFSIVQRDVASDYLGRVFGIIFTIAVLFMPIGSGVFSFMLKTTFLFNFSIVGVGMIILAVIFRLVFSRKNKYQK
ncbi:MFS transporter [Streptococcus sp.]|uniref:MFS transporter n=1 Tax=Streptococcus sp. TaxID=1306 RepID=UPI0017C509BE|nr:MFS transporter [Streptococcus sp.]HHU65179.1 MFS transporter [Streptococcus sp.]